MHNKTENLYTPNCIRTYSGKYFNPCEPDIALIDITDIAHALSMQCRFGGHLPVFYTVAQHSVLTTEYVPQEYKLSALMHDASEAYLIDVPSPVKQNLHNYKFIEDKLMHFIAAKYGFVWPMPEPVRVADKYMLFREWKCLMLDINNGPYAIDVWPIETAKYKFLEMFLKLTIGI